MRNSWRWGLILCFAFAPNAYSEIYRSDTGALIPGTEGITPGPGVQLDQRELELARLSRIDLSGASFDHSNLQLASFWESTLTGARFDEARLYGADFFGATMRDASFVGADLSYADLRGDLTNADFSNANLTQATIQYRTLPDGTQAGTPLYGAKFDRAVIDFAILDRATDFGFAKEQLYSTSSYQDRNLRGIRLPRTDLRNWDFHGQDLTGAWFAYPEFFVGGSDLRGANFAGATLFNTSFPSSNLSGADFAGARVNSANLTSVSGFTAEQLYSTQSYQEGRLWFIGLGGNNLSGWNFRGQDLFSAGFEGPYGNHPSFELTNFTSAQFESANLQYTWWRNTVLTDADFTGADLRGATFPFISLDDAGAKLTNTIRPDGAIFGVALGNLQRLAVRNSNWEYYSLGTASSQPFPITVKSSMEIDRLGNVQLIFDQTSWYSTMKFEPGIRVKLGGTLELTFAGDVDVPTQIGRTLHIFDWTGVAPTGRFQVHVPRGTLWDVTKLYTTGEVSVLPILDDVVVPIGASHVAGGLNARWLTLNGEGSRLTIASIGRSSQPATLSALNIGAGATLDLTDNAAIIDYAGTSPVTTVREQIISGRGGAGLGGAWTGTGITSSTAAMANTAEADSRSLGYAENATMPLGPLTLFHGATVDETSVLIAFTRTGDANLDGLVNDDDVTIIGATYAPGVPQPSWALGDFDYNGFVDDDDVTLLDAFYDPSAAPLLSDGDLSGEAFTAVPEPGTVALLVSAMIAITLPLVACRKSR